MLEARLSRVRHPDLEERAREMSQRLGSEAARLEALAASLKADEEGRASPANFALDNGISLSEIESAKSELARALTEGKEFLTTSRDVLKRAKSFQRLPRPELKDPKPCPDIPDAPASHLPDPSDQQLDPSTERRLSEISRAWEERVESYKSATARLEQDLEKAAQIGAALEARLKAVQAASDALREAISRSYFAGLRAGNLVSSSERAAADCKRLRCLAQLPGGSGGEATECLRQAQAELDKAITEFQVVEAEVGKLRKASGEMALQLLYRDADLGALDVGAFLDATLAATTGGDPQAWLQAERAFKDSTVMSLEARARTIEAQFFAFAERGVYVLARRAQSGYGVGGEQLRRIRESLDFAYRNAATLQDRARTYLSKYTDAQAILVTARQNLAEARSCLPGGGREANTPPTTAPTVPGADVGGKVRVPYLKTRDRDEAKALARKAGLEPFLFELERSTKPQDDLIVTYQQPEAEELVDPGTIVHVGYNTPHDYQPDLELEPDAAGAGSGEEIDQGMPDETLAAGVGETSGGIPIGEDDQAIGSNGVDSGLLGQGHTPGPGPDRVIEGAWNEAFEKGTRETTSQNVPGVELPLPPASRDLPGTDVADQAQQIAAEAALDRQVNMSKPNWAEVMLGPALDLNRAITGGSSPPQSPSSSSPAGTAGGGPPAAQGGGCHIQSLRIGDDSHFVVVYPKGQKTNYIVWSILPPDGKACSSGRECMQKLIANRLPGARIHRSYPSRLKAEGAAQSLCPGQPIRR